jgi:hypothetical protein
MFIRIQQVPAKNLAVAVAVVPGVLDLGILD